MTRSTSARPGRDGTPSTPDPGARGTRATEDAGRAGAVLPESPAEAAPDRVPGTAVALVSRPAPPVGREWYEGIAPLLLGAAGVVMLPALALLLDRDAIGGLRAGRHPPGVGVARASRPWCWPA